MKSKREILRDESTEEGLRVWRAVDQAAAKAPKWMKLRAEKAFEERGRAITVSAGGKPVTKKG